MASTGVSSRLSAGTNAPTCTGSSAGWGRLGERYGAGSVAHAKSADSQLPCSRRCMAQTGRSAGSSASGRGHQPNALPRSRTCAISAARQTWRMSVDLPPMLGPAGWDCGGGGRSPAAGANSNRRRQRPARFHTYGRALPSMPVHVHLHVLTLIRPPTAATQHLPCRLEQHPQPTCEHHKRRHLAAAKTDVVGDKGAVPATHARGVAQAGGTEQRRTAVCSIGRVCRCR